MRRHFTSLLFLFLFFALPVAQVPGADTRPPDLLLAKVYDSQTDLEEYWVSEKLDGVRAFWDGQRFISRRGNYYNAPDWFTRGFPETPLDGELWMGRGTFDRLSGAVRRQVPDDGLWQQIHFMAFDLPGVAEPFDNRLIELERLVSRTGSDYLKLIRQFRVNSEAELRRRLQEVVDHGGEGLMLHLGSSLYTAGRTDDLLKLKTHDDAEATVIAHLPGKGKYKGMLGALLVETPESLRFRIGTGFSDRERENPPPVGATITYKYFGKTGTGTPRFASFMRIREP